MILKCPSPALASLQSPRCAHSTAHSTSPLRWLTDDLDSICPKQNSAFSTYFSPHLLHLSEWHHHPPSRAAGCSLSVLPTTPRLSAPPSIGIWDLCASFHVHGHHPWATIAIPGPRSSCIWKATASLLPLWLPYGLAPKPFGVTLNVHPSEHIAPLLKALQWSESSPDFLPRTTRRPDLTPAYRSDHGPTPSPPSCPTFTCGCSHTEGRFCPDTCTVGSFQYLGLSSNGTFVLQTLLASTNGAWLYFLQSARHSLKRCSLFICLFTCL